MFEDKLELIFEDKIGW